MTPPPASAREIVTKIRHDAAALDDASFVRAFKVIPERIEEVVDALERELNIAAQHAVLQAEEIASLKDKVTAAWTAGRESADGGFYDGVEAAAAYMAAHSATSPKQLRELIARKAWGQRDTAYARGWTAGRDAAGEREKALTSALDRLYFAHRCDEERTCFACDQADAALFPPPESAGFAHETR